MNSQTPREALSQFYTDNHLDDDGGNGKPFVKIGLSKKFHFYIPNSDARRKAVPIHDVHHILNGYKTTFKGECEASAWEIASGCRKYWAAFLINTSGVMLGIPLYFRSVLKAWARGRRTKSLYPGKPSLEKALDMKISELQKELLLDKYPYETKVGMMDLCTLAAFSIWGLSYSVISLAMLPLVAIYSVYVGLFVDRTS